MKNRKRLILLSILVPIFLIVALISGLIWHEKNQATKIREAQITALKKMSPEMTALIKDNNSRVTSVEWDYSSMKISPHEGLFTQNGWELAISGQFNHLKDSEVDLTFLLDKKSDLPTMKGLVDQAPDLTVGGDEFSNPSDIAASKAEDEQESRTQPLVNDWFVKHHVALLTALNQLNTLKYGKVTAFSFVSATPTSDSTEGGSAVITATFAKLPNEAMTINLNLQYDDATFKDMNAGASVNVDSIIKHGTINISNTYFYSYGKGTKVPKGAWMDDLSSIWIDVK